jgi:hypothetical protein
MVTIESMAMGCVPVAYDTPSGSTEIIMDGQSGLLVPLGNYKAMAHKIKMLHSDARVLAELSAGAILRARTEFSAEALGTRTANFLSKVRAHSEVSPCPRKVGSPEQESIQQPGHRGVYAKLPPQLRALLRRRLAAFPRVSCWLLAKWNG